ncbi:NACHT, LRR and PYD domains-containing protein 12 [Chanos chanos]|uniref:NACHT, LRR and PYD domains-containing protein 12 n=1 Tax=Chanos chanos TaxID=29144 RepID=A0A6J2WAW2_CHACN|nr:NACHT, LRR and PYD domains-containing protein 12-like [Chanos chanos]
MATPQDAKNKNDVLSDVQRLHMETVKAKLQSETTPSSLLGGQSVPELLLNNYYLPVSVSEDGSECLELDSEMCSTVEEFLSQAFSPDSEGCRIVLYGTVGVGKTTATEWLLKDWASGACLQQYTLLLKVCAREMNKPAEEFSLQNLLLRAHAHLTAEFLSLAFQRPNTLLLILDGLENCQNLSDVSGLISDPLQKASASVLLASLLKGSLLPAASVLVTSREPVSLEPVQCVQVLGFSEVQWRTFFQRFFSEKDGAARVFQHCKQTLGVQDLCVCPAFCWTLCSVFKTQLQSGEEFPQTLTQLLSMITVKLLQEQGMCEERRRVLLIGLGRLANQCTPFTNYTSSQYTHSTFSTSHIIACGLQDLLDSQKLFAFIRMTHDVATSDGTFCFLSPVMQEFLVALSFYLDQSGPDEGKAVVGRSGLCDAFLAGLSDPSQRKLLEGSVGVFRSERVSEFRDWLRDKAVEVLQGFAKEEHINCMRLLQHTQDPRLIRESVQPNSWRTLSYSHLQDRDYATLSYVTSCLEEVRELNLYGSSLTEQQVLALTPALRLAHSITLSQSTLSPAVVRQLAAALSDSHVTDLDLSSTKLGDAGADVLFPGLTHSDLSKLKLSACALTEACGKSLAIMLAGGSKLRILDLRANDLRDQGLIPLCDMLRSTHCKLQELCLDSCELTVASMPALASALTGGLSGLKSLDLMRNSVTDQGVQSLSHALQEGNCSLTTLRLFDCELTGSCCSALAAALQSANCSLTDLELSVNELGESGAMLICDALKSPNCSLEKLSIVRCELTEANFRALGSALVSGICKLKELSVGLNRVGDSGAKHLWTALKHTHCKLELLDVEMLDLTDNCVEELCEAVAASNTLSTLILKNNKLTDSSVLPLVKMMQDRQAMQELNLQYNEFSEDVFEQMDTCPKIRY